MDPTLSALLTVGGVATVVTILEEVILRAAAMSDRAQDRFGPLIAIGLGILVSVLAVFALGLAGGQTIGQAVLTGITAGASAMGIHDFASGPVASAVDPGS